MPELCHRCGAEIAPGDSNSFCPHCGAPQLVLFEDAQPPAVSSTTGTLPPPLPNPIDWETAIRCTLPVAAIAAVLSFTAIRIQLLSPFSSIWILSGSLTTLTLYQRRRPLAWMDAGVGARIGLVVGLALVACLGGAWEIGGLVARYGLHSLGAFDAELTQMLHAQFEKAAAMSPQPPEMQRFWFSPEFRAGMMLVGFAMLSGILLVLSTVGGAVGGFMRMRRKVSV